MGGGHLLFDGGRDHQLPCVGQHRGRRNQQPRDTPAAMAPGSTFATACRELPDRRQRMPLARATAAPKARESSDCGNAAEDSRGGRQPVHDTYSYAYSQAAACTAGHSTNARSRTTKRSTAAGRRTPASSAAHSREIPPDPRAAVRTRATSSIALWSATARPRVVPVQKAALRTVRSWPINQDCPAAPLPTASCTTTARITPARSWNTAAQSPCPPPARTT